MDFMGVLGVRERVEGLEGFRFQVEEKRVSHRGTEAQGWELVSGKTSKLSDFDVIQNNIDSPRLVLRLHVQL
jgi:hypothetical protein